MKTITKRFRAFFLLLLCLTLVIPPRIDSNAKSAQYNQAMKAYKTWLGRNTVRVIGTEGPLKGYYLTNITSKTKYSPDKASNVKFALANIDSDGIPELIISVKKNNRPLFGILTFKNGRITRVYSSNGLTYFGGYFNGTGYINMTSIESYCKKSLYCQLNGTSIKTMYYQSYKRKLGDLDMYYGTGGKLLSKSRYTKQVRSATQGKAKTTLVLHQNTAANRNKFLK